MFIVLLAKNCVDEIRKYLNVKKFVKDKTIKEAHAISLDRRNSGLDATLVATEKRVCDTIIAE